MGGMVKESLARVVSSPISLEEDEWRERPVDQIHAMAKAQLRDMDGHRRYNLSAIGRALYPAMILPLDDPSLPAVTFRAARELAYALRAKGFRLALAPDTAQSVALQAVREYREPACRTCKGRVDIQTGRASIPDTDRIASGWQEGDGPIPMRPCPSCGGSGLHRYGDQERAGMLGEGHKTMNQALDIAHSLMAAALDRLDRLTAELRRD